MRKHESQWENSYTEIFWGFCWSWFQLICTLIIDCQNSHLSGLDLDIYPSIAVLYFPQSFIPYWYLAICTFLSAMSSFLVYLQCSCIFHHKDIWCSRALLARGSSDFLSSLPCNHTVRIWIWFPCVCCLGAILALFLIRILNHAPHNVKTFLDVWLAGVRFALTLALYSQSSHWRSFI